MRVSSLSGISAAQLAPILEEEAGHWEAELFWDFRPTASLISRYVGNRSLCGSCLRGPSGSLLGYEYHVADAPVGYLGDVYVLDKHAGSLPYSSLISSALSDLERRHRVKRIECQLFPFNYDVRELLEQNGFAARERVFLTRDLKTGLETTGMEPPPGIRLAFWSPASLDAAADVIYDSYRNSPDQQLCHDYQTQQGCRRFLRNVVDSPSCGEFQQQASFLALTAQGETAGVLLSSLARRDTVMIPQISVRRRFQKKGIGTMLMNTFLRQARSLGWVRASLSVSTSNREAIRLYSRFDFEKAKDFCAFVRNAEQF